MAKKIIAYNDAGLKKAYALFFKRMFPEGPEGFGTTFKPASFPKSQGRELAQAKEGFWETCGYTQVTLNNTKPVS